MARVILVAVGLLALIGGGSSSLAVPDIPQPEAEAAIESAYGWMACDALNPAGTYDKEEDRCRYLYCGRCNYEPERGIDAYVRETCFMLTYVESRGGAWELSSVQTVDPDHFATLEQARLDREVDRKNRGVLAFSLLGWPIIVCGVILIITLIALRTRGGSRPRHLSAHAFRLDYRRPRPAQSRNHWTVHEDE